MTSDELVVDHGIVFRSNRCVIPHSLRHEVLQKVHESHMGAEGCIRRARESVFWPGMTAQVRDYVAKCGMCQMFGQKQQRETLSSTEFTLQPWNTVRVDLFHFAGMNFLMVVDYYSIFREVDNLQLSSGDCHFELKMSLFAVWSAGYSEIR